MIYHYKKYKIIYILSILISIVLFITNFISFLEYKYVSNAVLMVILAITPFIITGIYHHYEKFKYQIIMSIIYNKYIENDNTHLYAILNWDLEHTNQLKQTYDELYEKLTEQEWQNAVKKFHKLKKEFEEVNLKKIEMEENNKGTKYRGVLQNQKWLFRYNLEDKE